MKQLESKTSMASVFIKQHQPKDLPSNSVNRCSRKLKQGFRACFLIEIWKIQFAKEKCFPRLLKTKALTGLNLNVCRNCFVFCIFSWTWRNSHSKSIKSLKPQDQTAFWNDFEHFTSIGHARRLFLCHSLFHCMITINMSCHFHSILTLVSVINVT